MRVIKSRNLLFRLCRDSSVEYAGPLTSLAQYFMYLTYM